MQLRPFLRRLAGAQYERRERLRETCMLVRRKPAVVMRVSRCCLYFRKTVGAIFDPTNDRQTILNRVRIRVGGLDRKGRAARRELLPALLEHRRGCFSHDTCHGLCACTSAATGARSARNLRFPTLQNHPRSSSRLAEGSSSFKVRRGHPPQGECLDAATFSTEWRRASLLGRKL